MPRGTMQLGCTSLQVCLRIIVGGCMFQNKARVLLAWMVSCASEAAQDPNLADDDELKTIASALPLG